MCGTTLKLADGTPYAEAHHVQPLGGTHQGPDVPANILCVCPNCHALCDFGAIRLEFSKLTAVDGHAIDRKYVDHHNAKIYRG